MLNTFIKISGFTHIHRSYTLIEPDTYRVLHLYTFYGMNPINKIKLTWMYIDRRSIRILNYLSSDTRTISNNNL